MANGDSVGIWNNTFGTLALTNSDSAEDIAEAYAVLTSYQGITFVYEGDPNANVKPELQATNATIEEGNTDSIEALTKATAADKEDGDLTKAITVKDDGGFDANKAGTYQVVLAVADSAGKTAEKTVAITVTAKPVVNQKPVITAKDATIEVGGSETDVKTIVNAAATDKEDGDLTSNVKVKDDGGFDSNKAGTYDVVLTVKDSAGEKAKTTAKITVTAKPVDKISNAAEQKTVTRTIKYVYENGKKASTTIKQKIHFSRNVATNETTGEVTNGEWTTTNKNSAFKAVESPTIGGYTADKENVKKAKVTADSKNKVVTVTYAKVADASKPTTDTSTSTTGTTGSTTIIIGSGNTITNNPITNNDNDTVNNNTTNNDNDTTNNTTINNVTTIGTPTGDSTTDTTKTDTTKDSTTDTTKTDTTKDSTTDTTKTDTTKDSTTDTTKTDTTKDSTTDTTKTDTTKDSTTDTTKTDTTKDSTTDTTKTDTTKDSTTDTTKTDTTKDSTTDTTKTDTTKDSTTDTTKEDATKGDTITNNTTNNVNNGVINNNVTNNNGTSTGDTIKDDTTKNDTTTKGDTTNNVTTNNGGTTNNTTNNVTTNNGDTTNNTSATTTNDTTKGDTAKDDTTKDDSIKTANNKGTGSNTVGDTTNNNTAGTGGAAADNQNGAGTGVDGNGITSPTTSTIYTPASSSALRGVLPTTYTPAKSASGTTSGASTGSGYSATGSSITPSSYGVTSSRSSLPNTGEQHTTAASIIGVVIAGFAGLGLTIKKKFGKN
jgi:LPXTG-motif cell wall-anchored protein